MKCTDMMYLYTAMRMKKKNRQNMVESQKHNIEGIKLVWNNTYYREGVLVFKVQRGLELIYAVRGQYIVTLE